MIRKGQTVYVTKYALTRGIEKHEADEDLLDGNHPVSIMVKGFYWRLFVASEVFTTPAEAIAKAEDMRVRKIKSLKKQLAKLEAMTFEVKEASE